MAKKVLSIEIGYSLTKILEVDYQSKNPKVYHCVSVQTPEGVVNDGTIQVSPQLAESIRRCLAENRIKTKLAVFSITSSKIASREIAVPKVKENKIRTLIETNASDFFPVQLSDYELGYKQLENAGDENGRMRFLVYAAPKKILQGYAELAAACGLVTVGYDYGGNSLYQVLKEECASGTQMVVKVDERTTLITILQNQRLVLQRNIVYGVDAIVHECMENEGMNYTEALALLRRTNCLAEGEAGPESTETVGYLINGVMRVIDYYNSKNADMQIEKIYLTGLGGDFVGLAEQLMDGLGIQPEVLRKAEGFNVEKYFKDASFGTYIGCLGAAVSPIGFITEEKETTKKSSDAASGVAVLIFVGGIVISLALLVASLMPYLAAKKENEDKKLYLVSLQYISEIYNQYSIEKAENEYLQALELATLNHNEEIVAFIEELEEKMPSDIKVVSLLCDEESVLMSVEVGSKNEAADVLDTLLDFKSLAGVDVTAVSDATGDNGIRVVSFTVQCTYYPYGDTVEETQTEEVEQNEAE